MKLNELNDMLTKLQEELSNTGENHHIKAASKRARLILNDLKKSITSIKQELIELDKK